MRSFCHPVSSTRTFPFFLTFAVFLLLSFLPRTASSNDWVYESSGYYGVWGSSASDIFAVGRYGTIHHYDGVFWLPMQPGTDSCASGMKLLDIWGSSANDVFTVGCYDQAGGPFCTSDDNVIVHYDGNTWSRMSSGVDGSLNAVWGSSASDVYAVGSSGLILHYNGTSWSPMASNTSSSLYDIWGSSGADVFAVGNSGTILHFDGSTWDPMASTTTANLTGVWGMSSSSVYGIGDGGVILHYDGSSWSPMTSPTTANLNSIWGSSDYNMYASGTDGTVIHFNGSNWSIVDAGTTVSLAGIWGSSATNIFLVGTANTIKHFNGSTWATHSEGTSEDLYDVWGTSENNVYAVGLGGTILHRDSRGWQQMDSGTSEILLGIWGSSSNNIYAAGEAGTVLQYNGSSWSQIYSDPDLRFNDIWGSSGADIYIIGYRRTGGSPDLEGYFLHFDGSTWTSDVFSGFYTLADIWGTGPDDIFIVGWARDPDDKDILHYNGSSWSLMDTTADGTLQGVCGSSADHVFAVGTTGSIADKIPHIFKYNGSSWTAEQLDLPPDFNGLLYDVAGRAGDDVFAVGKVDEGGGYAGQLILTNQGGNWYVDRNRLDEKSLHEIWGSENGHLFAVGASGTILRLPPLESSTADPSEPWAMTYDGGSSDLPVAVTATSDGGSIVVGETSSFGTGEQDIWVIKFSGDGTIQWQMTYGGAGTDFPSSIIQTTDFGYLISGTTSSFGSGDNDAWLLKLDAFGNIEWQKAYGGPGDDRGTAVLEAAGCDAGYVLLGKTVINSDEADNWLMQVDQDGTTLWQKTYPLAGTESLDTLVAAKGYGYLASGRTDPFDSGYGDFLVMRFDDEGDIIWQKSFGLYSFVPPDQYNMNVEQSARVHATEDGGAVLAGSSQAPMVNSYVWFLKLNASGDSEWQKIYAPLGDSSVKFIEQTTDLGYLVGGNIYGAICYGWLMKLSKSGLMEWTNVYASSGEAKKTFFYDAQQMEDGGYTAIGTSYFYSYEEADFLVLRLDETGSIPDCAVVSNWYSSTEDVFVTGAAYSATSVATSLTESLMSFTSLVTEISPADNCLSLSGDIIDLPKTGQNTCFDAAGNVIPCPDSEQDGEIQAGVAWPQPRFFDNGDGTMVDMLTGLMWLKDGNCALTIGHDPDSRGTGTMSWQFGLDFIAGINDGSYNISACTSSSSSYGDWRMANLNEIESLFHAGILDPADWLNNQGFNNVPLDPLSVYGSSYWSSTPLASLTNYGGYVWVVDLNRGRVEYKRKTNYYHVWPVRGGVWFHPDPAYPANIWKTGTYQVLSPGDDGTIQAGVAWPNPRFADHGDGTVTDNLTGLMWIKDAACFGGRRWLDALATVSDFNIDPGSYFCQEYSAAHADWRMANRKEYRSLIDYSEPAYGGHPSLVEDHPFVDVTGGAYWSSTTDESRALKNSAYTFFSSGALTTQSKFTYFNRLWPVRGWPRCRADLDTDGDVDGLDMTIFLADWQRTDCCEDEVEACEGDLDESCTVDQADFAGLAYEFGRENCPVPID